ncbi:MAG: hypothetical protein ACRDBO_19290 [Lachnospiraceae bacterium]
MGRQKKRIDSGRMVLWTILILIQMTVIRCLDVKAEMEDYAAELITIYSGLYAEAGQEPTPDIQYVDEAGREYELDSWELIPVVAAGQNREIDKIIRYPGVEGAARIPQTIEVQIGEGSRTETVVCAIESQEVVQEYWEDGFSFPITFHMYHSGSYRLQDQMVPYNDEKPELDGCEILLLQLIGLSETEYRITDIQWSGEVYQNEAGEICRDAAAAGEKIVRDIQAVYRGQTMMADFHGWQVKAVYRAVQDIGSQPSAAASAQVSIQNTAEVYDEAITPITLWQKIMNTLLITITIGALLFFVGLLLLFLLHLVKTIRTCYNKLR